jgi:hypothetical protein
MAKRTEPPLYAQRKKVIRQDFLFLFFKKTLSVCTVAKRAQKRIHRNQVVSYSLVPVDKERWAD